MALTRRSQRMNTAIWPGFVDAMTGLLLVLMFVLTVFMVVQFVLQETITGQESELNELADEVAALASALGLEQARSADLTTQLGQATEQATTQAGVIARLTAERDRTATALAGARSQITGFEAEVAALVAAQAARDAVISERDSQIARLSSDLDAGAATITALTDQIADRDATIAAQAGTLADLEAAQTELLTEQQALDLALARARSEIDEGAEAARLAAARREALEALIADLEAGSVADNARIAALEATGATNAAQISDLEAARLADAAAAQALRDRLENADAELTAMTLSLEEQRREAEETLTLLAASQAARDDLDMNLAAALLARQQAENDLARALNEGDDLDARLLAALGLAENTAAELEEARAALAAAELEGESLSVQLAAALAASVASDADLATVQAALEAALAEGEASQAEVEARLAAAILAQQAAEIEAQGQAATAQSLEQRLAEAFLTEEALRAEVASLSEDSTAVQQDVASLSAQLAEALAGAEAAEQSAQDRDALLQIANAALSKEEELSAESRREVALLNEQVADLRNQVGTLQTLLDVANDTDADSQVQIEQLGSQLNTALARVAAEERRRRALEEAERQRLQEEAERLAAEAQDLQRFRSDFFGQLRQVLEGQDGVQIVGDRFVFSSEVLFRPGEAELSFLGRGEIAKVADILRAVADDIPDGIDWIIRVDGHTDDIPLSGTGEFRDNWELSQARALSVVRYMEGALGIPPQRLAANGFGEFQPINPADSDAARAQNRRIEIKLTER